MEFTDLLDEHGIQYHNVGQHHHATRGFVQIDCPWCSPDEGKFRMGYNLQKRYFTCWVCGYMPPFDTIKLLTGLDHKECVGVYKELPAVETYDDYVRRTGKTTTMPAGVCDISSWHLKYIQNRSRGWLWDLQQVLDLWKPMAINITGGFLRWRIWIPIFQDGIMVAWTARSIGSKMPRYLSSTDEESSVPISNTLYGVDYCRQQVVVVEGPLDAWAMGPGAVALCGQAMTPARMEVLSRFPVRVVCLDNEPEAQERADRLARDLSVFPGKTYRITLDTGKDPASADKREIRSVRKKFLDSGVLL